MTPVRLRPRGELSNRSEGIDDWPTAACDDRQEAQRRIYSLRRQPPAAFGNVPDARRPW
jgi:hypothetical protein